MLPDIIRKVLDKIATDLNFIEFSLKTESASKHGDNFQGVLLAVTIDGTQQIGGELVTNQLDLVCKVAPEDIVRRANFRTKLVFDREILAYTKVLPALVEFQREKGVGEANSFLAFPKVYGFDVNAYIIVMENLRMQNYLVRSKKEVIPLDHALLLMKELGKFHGISFALKDQRPNEFDEYKKLTDTHGEIMRGKLAIHHKQTLEMVEHAVKDPIHKNIVKNFDINRMLDQCFNWEACDKFGVISHGDCWCTNVMFQYSDANANILKSVSIIDWQLMRYVSPAMDLLYYIFGSTDKAFRDKYYDKLLQTYYGSLSEIVRQLGSNPDKLFTYQDLQNELQRFGQYALWSGPMVKRSQLADSEDVADLDEFAKGEEEYMIRPFSGDKQAVFNDLANDIVLDLYNLGYIGRE